MIDQDRICVKCWGMGTVVPKHSKSSTLECVSCGGTGIVHRLIAGYAEKRDHMRKIGRRYGPLNADRAFEGHQGFVTAEEAEHRRAKLAPMRQTGELDK